MTADRKPARPINNNIDNQIAIAKGQAAAAKATVETLHGSPVNGEISSAHLDAHALTIKRLADLLANEPGAVDALKRVDILDRK